MEQTHVPKYKSIHDELLRRLKDGHYSVGSRLPTEDSLAQTFDVSRVTVRKALELLVQAGYVISRQGSGYHVSTLSPPSTTCLISFTDAVLNQGHIPGARLVGLTRFETGAAGAPPDEFGEPVMRIQRVRTVDGEPRMLVNTWVPARLVPGISKKDFPQSGSGQSILRILGGRFGLSWSSACETIRSCGASDEVARLLNLPARTPILSQVCLAMDDQGALVFYDEVFRDSPITFQLTGGRRQEVAAATS